MFAQRRTVRFSPAFNILLVLSLVVGCRPSPQPTQIATPTPVPIALVLDVNPNVKEIEAGTTVAIVARVSTGEAANLTWSVTGNSGGQLSSETGDAVFYTAGDPGADIVTAEGTTADGAPVKERVSFNVVAAETVTPVPSTDTPSPSLTGTPTPRPVVEITQPVDAIDCPGTGACLFTVEGTSSNVMTSHDLRIYVFVFPIDPPGSGWYPQVSPATVKQDGTWLQTPAWLGSEQYPAKSGDTFQIVALVVHKDADWNGTKPSAWSPGAAMPTYQDIDYVTVSDVVSLRVK